DCDGVVAADQRVVEGHVARVVDATAAVVEVVGGRVVVVDVGVRDGRDAPVRDAAARSGEDEVGAGAERVPGGRVASHDAVVEGEVGVPVRVDPAGSGPVAAGELQSRHREVGQRAGSPEEGGGVGDLEDVRVGGGRNRQIVGSEA